MLMNDLIFTGMFLHSSRLNNGNVHVVEYLHIKFKIACMHRTGRTSCITFCRGNFYINGWKKLFWKFGDMRGNISRTGREKCILFGLFIIIIMIIIITIIYKVHKDRKVICAI